MSLRVTVGQAVGGGTRLLWTIRLREVELS